MIEPTASFKDNLQLLPSIDGLAKINLIDADGNIVATTHGLDIFAEHTADAKNRPGAHPNIDRLLEIVAGAAPLKIELVAR